jgi:hypothetical protein
MTTTNQLFDLDAALRIMFGGGDVAERAIVTNAILHETHMMTLPTFVSATAPAKDESTSVSQIRTKVLDWMRRNDYDTSHILGGS